MVVRIVFVLLLCLFLSPSVALAEEVARRDPARSVKPGSGASFRDRLADGQPCAYCPEMVVAPAGSFMMGSPPNEAGRNRDEGPQHTVAIARPYAVGKFEVTFAEWDACAANGGCPSNPRPVDQGWGRGRRPVISVSWNDAKEYVGWLSRTTGKIYRLLSEAEWEYAARAGTMTRYAFGDTISKSQAQYSQAHHEADKTAKVGTFQPNAWGLYDMHGNVSEWVEDTYHPNYEGAPVDGSVWLGGDLSYHVVRGGSWGSYSNDFRSANRGAMARTGSDVGFRVARML